MAHITHWDDQYPLKAVIDLSRLRNDSLPKDAQKMLEESITGRIYDGITERIRAAIEKAPMDEAGISRLIPKANGVYSIGDRQLRKYITAPYKMNVAQVEGLCAACNCNIHYLRGDYRDAIPSFPMDTDEYRTMSHIGQALQAYRILTESNIEERLYADLGTVVGVLHSLGIVPAGFDDQYWNDGFEYETEAREVSGTISIQRYASLLWAIQDLHGCFELIESTHTSLN